MSEFELKDFVQVVTSKVNQTLDCLSPRLKVRFRKLPEKLPKGGGAFVHLDFDLLLTSQDAAGRSLNKEKLGIMPVAGELTADWTDAYALGVIRSCLEVLGRRQREHGLRLNEKLERLREAAAETMWEELV